MLPGSMFFFIKKRLLNSVIKDWISDPRFILGDWKKKKNWKDRNLIIPLISAWHFTELRIFWYSILIECLDTTHHWILIIVLSGVGAALFLFGIYCLCKQWMSPDEDQLGEDPHDEESRSMNVISLMESPSQIISDSHSSAKEGYDRTSKLQKIHINLMRLENFKGVFEGFGLFANSSDKYFQVKKQIHFNSFVFREILMYRKKLEYIGSIQRNMEMRMRKCVLRY